MSSVTIFRSNVDGPTPESVTDGRLYKASLSMQGYGALGNQSTDVTGKPVSTPTLELLELRPTEKTDPADSSKYTVITERYGLVLEAKTNSDKTRTPQITFYNQKSDGGVENTTDGIGVLSMAIDNNKPQLRWNNSPLLTESSFSDSFTTFFTSKYLSYAKKPPPSPTTS